MNSFQAIMSAFFASSVAILVGATLQAMTEWRLLYQPGPTMVISSSMFVPCSPLPFFYAGAVFGAILSGAVNTIFGFQLSMAFFDGVVISGLLTITFPIYSTWHMIIGGSLILGIGVGALTAIVPAYVGEISHPKFRGCLGMLFPVIMVTGVTVSNAFGPFEAYDSRQPLRLSLNVCCCLCALLHAIVSCFLPKSIYSYSSSLICGNKNDRCKMLTMLNSSDGVTLIEMYYQDWSTHDDYFEKLWTSYTPDSLTYRVENRSLLIGVGCMFFSHICGINTTISYMNHILKISNICINSKTISISLGLFQIVCMYITMFTIDKIGRRILLISSAMIMGIFSIVLAFCTIHMKLDISTTYIEYLSLVFTTVFIFAYSLGFGPIPWVIMGEIFSIEVKSYGICFATAMHWVMIFADFYFPYEITKYIDTEYIFILNFVLCLLGAFFSWTVIPETKKESLAEVQCKIASKSLLQIV